MGYVCDIDNDTCLTSTTKSSILCWHCVHLFKLIVNDRGKFSVLIIVKRPACFSSKKYKYRNFRLMALLGLTRYAKPSRGPPDNEEESKASEYTEVRKQLDKTKKRVKALVNVIEVQNALLRRLAIKIDPDAEMEIDEIRPTLGDERVALGEDMFDGQPPNETTSETPHFESHITAC